MQHVPHQLVLGILIGFVAAAMILNSVYAEWSEADDVLFGNIGVLPFAVAVITLAFLAARAQVDSKALENTRASLEHSRRAEVATRFQKAVEMLSNEKEAIRIGGLYMLRDVVVDSPDGYWQSVVDSLIPFLVERCRGPLNWYEKNAEMEEHEPIDDEASLGGTPADVLIAFKLIGAADPAARLATAHLPAREIRVAGLVLAFVELEGLRLDRFAFDGAVFQEVTFRQSSLVGAHLPMPMGGVTFEDCDCTDASVFANYMVFAHAVAVFRECNLQDAFLDGHRSAAVEVDNSLVDGIVIRNDDTSLNGCFYANKAPSLPETESSTNNSLFPISGARWRQTTPRGMTVYSDAEVSPSNFVPL